MFQNQRVIITCKTIERNLASYARERKVSNASYTKSHFDILVIIIIMSFMLYLNAHLHLWWYFWRACHSVVLPSLINRPCIISTEMLLPHVLTIFQIVIETCHYVPWSYVWWHDPEAVVIIPEMNRLRAMTQVKYLVLSCTYLLEKFSLGILGNT